MSAAPYVLPLVIRLRCRSCPNNLTGAFAREDPSSGRKTEEVLIGGRWVSVGAPPAARAEATVVCLACGAPDPEGEVFEVPRGAADAEDSRHLVVEVLSQALRLSEKARERAEAPDSRGAATALRELRELHERINDLLAEGGDRGVPLPALRAAQERIGMLRETTMRDCRELRWKPRRQPR